MWNDFYKEFYDIINDKAVQSLHNQPSTTMNTTQILILIPSFTHSIKLEGADGQCAQKTQQTPPTNNATDTLETTNTTDNEYPKQHLLHLHVVVTSMI